MNTAVHKHVTPRPISIVQTKKASVILFTIIQFNQVHVLSQFTYWFFFTYPFFIFRSMRSDSINTNLHIYQSLVSSSLLVAGWWWSYSYRYSLPPWENQNVWTCCQKCWRQQPQLKQAQLPVPLSSINSARDSNHRSQSNWGTRKYTTDFPSLKVNKLKKWQNNKEDTHTLIHCLILHRVHASFEKTRYKYLSALSKCSDLTREFSNATLNGTVLV